VEGELAVKVTGKQSILLTTHGTRQYLFDEILDETATQVPLYMFIYIM
jgi:hypothetical protein